MENQTPSKGLARNSDPITSFQAAESVDADGKEAAVLRALLVLGPSTWDEITERTGIRAGSISPRFKPLRDKDLIADSGVKRPGESGRSQTVWMLTLAGRNLAEKLPESEVDDARNVRVVYVARHDPDPKALEAMLADMEPGQIISTADGSEVVVATAGVAAWEVDKITDDQWNLILDGQVQMKGWIRKRMKRAIRLLTEGHTYDDPNEDSRTLPRKKVEP